MTELDALTVIAVAATVVMTIRNHHTGVLDLIALFWNLVSSYGRIRSMTAD
jgi:hypothetical protein